MNVKSSLMIVAVAGCLGAPAALRATCKAKSEPPPQDAQVRGDEVLLTFDEVNGTDLFEFLAMYQRHTGVVLSFDPKDVDGVVIHMLGPVRIARDQYHSFFETVLFNLDFCVVADGPVLRLVRLDGAAARRSGAPFVSIDELEAHPGRWQIVVTVFPLERAAAVEVAPALQRLATDDTEVVEAIPSAHCVLMSAPIETIRRAARIVDAIERSAAMREGHPGSADEGP